MKDLQTESKKEGRLSLPLKVIGEKLKGENSMHAPPNSIGIEFY